MKPPPRADRPSATATPFVSREEQQRNGFQVVHIAPVKRRLMQRGLRGCQGVMDEGGKREKVLPPGGACPPYTHTRTPPHPTHTHTHTLAERGFIEGSTSGAE